MKPLYLIIVLNLLFTKSLIAQGIPIFHGPGNEVKKRLSDDLPDASKTTQQFSFSLDTPNFPTSPHPSQFGVSEKLSIGVSNPGKMTTWTTKITSPKSKNLGVTLGNISLGKNSKIYVYNRDGSDVIGPLDHNSLNPKLKKFTSTETAGNEIFIHVIEGEESETSFDIIEVVHGFKEINMEENFQDQNNTRTAGISSVACIPDASCLTDYEKELDAVVRITISGWTGTGTFLNNENVDRRGFILTAYHLVDTDDNGTVSTAEAAAFGAGANVRIDHRTTSCIGTVNEGTLLPVGGELRAWWKTTDFALLELTNIPTLARRVTYAGWNRTGSTPSSVISLHHPEGNNLRYSISTNVRVFPLNWNFFEITSWVIGATKGGSSGGPLFNENHQVVGQLAGGLSGCTFLLNDIYGRFYDSWEGGGTAQTQLKAWLSPNSNLSSMNLLDPMIFVGGNTTVCSGTSTVVGLPYGLPIDQPVWTVTNGVNIVSSNHNSITLTATDSYNSGSANVTATFGNHSITKTVWFGKPKYSNIIAESGWVGSGYGKVMHPSAETEMEARHEGYTDISEYGWEIWDHSNWNISRSRTISHSAIDMDYWHTPTPHNQRILIRAKNVCGWGDYQETYWTFSSSFAPFTISPNPTSDQLTILFEGKLSKNRLPSSVELISEKGNRGLLKDQPNFEEIERNNNKLTFKVNHLPKGIYYVHLTYENGKVDKKRVVLE